MAPFKGLGIIWIVLLSYLSLGNSSNSTVNVRGPDGGFVEDFEKFTCEVEGSNKKEIQWMYELKDGNRVAVKESEMLSPLEEASLSDEKLMVTSFLKIRADMQAIVCEHSSKAEGSKAVEVEDFSPVTSSQEPCMKAKETGKPVVVLYTNSMNFVEPYRKGHYLSDAGKNKVLVSYPFDVSQAKLVCVSYDDSPRWTLKPGTIDKMKFAAWTQPTFGTEACSRQIVDILKVEGKGGGSVTELSFECHAGSSSVPVKIDFQFPFSRSGAMDFNQTQDCVDTIVEQFYGKELTGVGIGSSFAIIAMMFGMAYLKKQLSQQQKINRGQQNSKNSAAGTAPSLIESEVSNA